MKRNEHDLEKYLSEFKVRKVKPLQLPRPEIRMSLVRLAIAAVVLVSTAGGLWYGHWMKATKTATPSPRTSDSQVVQNVAAKNAFALTKLALEDDRQFQAELAQESPVVLPDFQDTRGSLYALTRSKE